MRLALRNDAGEPLAIEDGRIVDAVPAAALTLHVGAAHFQPGLINAHDHLYLNHYGRLGAPPYEDSYAWGTDIHERYRSLIERAQRLPRRDALLFGAFRNIIAGVTTVVHHDAWHETLDDAFPLRLARVHVVHSLGFERDPAAALAASGAAAGAPLCMHVAEGTNARAAAEVDELDARGLLHERLLAVHLVGVNDAGIERLRGARAGLVWCPTSNEFLFGRTAPRGLFEAGIDVLLGTDSLLTGAGTLLDELRAARRYGHLGDERLLDAVGATAARRLGLPVPALVSGAAADVIALRAPLFDAVPADLALVLVRGAPVLADAALADVFAAAGVPGATLRVGGVAKVVAAPLAASVERTLQLMPERAGLLE